MTLDILKKLDHLQTMYKLVVFVGNDALEKVKSALFQAGGGQIGDYDYCCFVSKGMGQFRPLAGANPHVGSVGRVEEAEEFRLETVVPDEKIQAVVAAMKQAHPYETPAYDVIKLEEF